MLTLRLVLFSLLFNSTLLYAASDEGDKQKIFSHESTLSLLNSGGNSDLQTYNFDTENIWRFRVHKINLSGHYTYGKSQGVESARNWSGGLRYDYFFTPQFSGLIGEQIEGDKFQGVDVRYNTDLGVSYLFFENKNSGLKGEVGYRYTYEKSIIEEDGSENYQKGRTYLEYRYTFAPHLSARLWVEYLPNFSESSDYTIRFSPSLRVVLSSLFSLSLSYQGNYDNEPAVAGRKKYDYQYTTGLIAKF